MGWVKNTLRYILLCIGQVHAEYTQDYQKIYYKHSFNHTYIRCIHTYIHTHTQTSARTHTHTHTHTHMPTRSISLQTVVATICTTCCNIKIFCMLSIHCFCDYHNRQQLLLYTALTDLSFSFYEIPFYTVELL